MVAKSIVDVQINDGAFRQFQENFAKYQEGLATTVEDWGKVGEGMTELQAMTSVIGAAILAQSDVLKEIVHNNEKSAHVERERVGLWQKIAASSKMFVGTMADGARLIGKWSVLGTVFGGLLGAGGLWGLDALANNVAAGRRGALGLGASYGGERAFGVDFGRFVDPNRFLSGISDLRGNISKQSGLFGLGFTRRQIESEETSQFSVDLLTRVKRIVDASPSVAIAQAQLHARGLGELFSTEDVRRLRSTSPQEFEQQKEAARRDSLAFGLDPDTLRKYQELSTQLTRAGKSIETVLIDDLSGLAGPIQKLSGSFTEAIDALLKSRGIKDLMSEISTALEHFAKYVATPKFEVDVKMFVTDVSEMAKAVVSALKWLHGLLGPSGPAPKDASGITPPGDEGVDITGRGNANIPTTAGQAKANRWLNFLFRHGEVSSEKEHEAFIRKEAAKLGIDPNVALRVAAMEGLYNKGGAAGYNDDGSSFGDFQIHVGGISRKFPHRGLGDVFRQATGLDPADPKNWKQEDEFALKWARDHGWSSWSSMRGHPQFEGVRAPHVRISVNNQTGGNVNVSSNQAGSSPH